MTSLVSDGRGDAAPRAARRATCLLFLMCGIALSSWAPMVPIVKARLGLEEGELGLILLALGSGGMAMMPMTGALIERFGSRLTLLVAGIAAAVALPLLTMAPSGPALAAVLFLFGGAVGVVDVAMNAQAVLVEARYGRPLMSSFHGLFSVGGLVGALGMSALVGTGLAPLACGLGVGALVAAITLTQHRDVLGPDRDAPRAAGGPVFVLPRGGSLLLGLLCFAVFMLEGAVLDWSAVFLRFFRGFGESQAGLGYAAFSVAMAVGRFTGDRLTQALGPVNVVRVGGLLTVAGLLIAVALPWGAAGLLGFVIIGLGASNIVPVLFSAAGRLPDMPASTAIAAVSTLGGAGLLFGPAVIGFAAEVTTLPLALGLVAVMMAAVALSARIVRPA
ncbi:MFS transporter [Azospirillum sp. SYSU D00513]|uniref:MFS transporter n=1 Tax=Azospirillum sp. SYSU D00513 TaxID=2812561 RepID=UPI001A96B14D|nr:MFS transporter [Azospirillum sp. SYSU D00513]